MIKPNAADDENGRFIPSVGLHIIESERVLEVKVRVFLGSGRLNFALIPSLTRVEEESIFTMGIGFRNRTTKPIKKVY